MTRKLLVENGKTSDNVSSSGVYPDDPMRLHLFEWHDKCGFRLR